MAYYVEGFDAEDFIIEALRGGSLTDAEARSVYSKLRRVANERLVTMGKSRYADSQAYKKNAGKYVPLSQIAKSKDPSQPSRELAYKLADLYKFVSSERSTVSGQRRIEMRALDTARERGLSFLNERNIHAFGEYMRDARAAMKGRQFDSERAVELFREATEKRFNPQEMIGDFEFWYDNYSALEALPRYTGKRNITANDYRERMGVK